MEQILEDRLLRKGDTVIIPQYGEAVVVESISTDRVKVEIRRGNNSDERPPIQKVLDTAGLKRLPTPKEILAMCSKMPTRTRKPTNSKETHYHKTVYTVTVGRRLLGGIE